MAFKLIKKKKSKPKIKNQEKKNMRKICRKTYEKNVNVGYLNTYVGGKGAGAEEDNLKSSSIYIFINE